MAGYLVACVTWHDQEAMAAYGKVAADSMRAYGGKYLVRGAPFCVLEGDAPKRLAIVEFPTAQAAKDWHTSAQYAPASAIRERHATTHWIVVMDRMP